MRRSDGIAFSCAGFTDPQLDEACAARITNEYDDWDQCRGPIVIDEWGNHLWYDSICQLEESPFGVDTEGCMAIQEPMDGAAVEFAFGDRTFPCYNYDEIGWQQDSEGSVDGLRVETACYSIGIPQLGLEAFGIWRRPDDLHDGLAVQGTCSMTIIYTTVALDEWDAGACGSTVKLHATSSLLANRASDLC